MTVLTYAQVSLSSSPAQEDADDEGKDRFVVKEILRTGEWQVIPTTTGKIAKPLKIVRDGFSDARTGVISLSDLVRNFAAIQNVQIPLSDDGDDHKNITRVNTGFVRDLWIVDGEGGSKLVAKMEFTEPDIRERVLRGTYADVSCGIPWAVTSRGKKFGAALEHVAITNRPFIDGLGPFLAASDGRHEDDVQVVAFGDDRTIDAATFPDRLADAKAALYPGASSLEALRKAAEIRAESVAASSDPEDVPLGDRLVGARESLFGESSRADARRRAAEIRQEMQTWRKAG